MTHEFRLADIGEGLEQAEIVEWRVAVGDTVRRDQPIVEVLTDKSNAELPAPVDGVVVELGGAVGDLVPVGAVLAIIDDSASAPRGGRSERAAPVPRPLPRAAQERADSVPPPPPPSTPTGTRPKASPATRQLASELGVALESVSGSGPAGRILRSDVEQAAGLPAVPPPPPRPAPPPAVRPPEPAPADVPAPAPPVHPDPVPARRLTDDPPLAAPELSPPPPAAGVEPLRGIRRVIADNMARSWSEIPHIHAFEQIDAEPLLELRSQLRNSGRDAFADLTPLTFFAAAVAATMRDHPQANATLDAAAATITHHPSVNLGLAVAAPQGLVVPVLRDAAELDLAELAVAVRRLVAAARNGELEPGDFRGGTVTITNFGSLGGEQALPLIRSPESVIFGFGSIRERPFVVDGSVVARPTMHVVLGADHRLLDGDVTTSMVRQLCDLITNPINLVLGA